MSVNRAGPELLAPCGINCAICSRFLAWSKQMPKVPGKIAHCAGCRARKYPCAFIKKGCPDICEGRFQFCFECATFPCRKVNSIDERYRAKFHSEPVQNLLDIKRLGPEKFFAADMKRHRCGNCGGTRSVHSDQCYDCEDIRDWRGPRKKA